MKVDINCDVGEGLDNEAQLLPYISSCNIACGAHAGDTDTITKVALLAKEHHVKVGAHPSYPDKANFGRVAITISREALKESIQSQLRTFQKIMVSNAVQLNHIKPHGALYNVLATDVDTAQTFLEAIKEYKKEVALYVPYNSIIEKEAKQKGFKIIREGFCDRNYNDDLTLVSRKKEKALITQPNEVLKHVLRIIKEEAVETVSGKLKKIKANTLCIHGDSPNAVKILRHLYSELPKNSITIDK